MPIDVVAQRIMATHAHDNIHATHVIRDIYLKSGDGYRGFYKGYLVTLAMSLPFNSTLWTVYWIIQTKLEQIIPPKHDTLVAPLSAITASLAASLVTQPIDVLKTRLQVAPQRRSLWRTSVILMHERGLRDSFLEVCLEF